MQQEVRAPSSELFELLVERAKRLSIWAHGPWRLWARLRRDRSWWVTLRQWGVAGVPVVRERYRDEAEARRRADALLRAVERGESLGRPSLWRRE